MLVSYRGYTNLFNQRTCDRQADEPNPPGLTQNLSPDESLDLVAPASRSLPINPYARALQRLISSAIPQDELPSLIKSIVSNVRADNIVSSLQGGDAQMFIDVMDMV